MNTKHTPGPWTVSPSSKASTLTRVFSVDEGRLVASANGPGLSESGEAEANARLIAAAPDTIDTLQAIVEWTESRDGDARTDENIIGTIGQMARAAIAKATGQE